MRLKEKFVLRKEGGLSTWYLVALHKYHDSIKNEVPNISEHIIGRKITIENDKYSAILLDIEEARLIKYLYPDFKIVAAEKVYK